MNLSNMTQTLWMQADDKTFIYSLNNQGTNRFWFKLQSSGSCSAAQSELESNADAIILGVSAIQAVEQTPVNTNLFAAHSGDIARELSRINQNGREQEAVERLKAIADMLTNKKENI